MNSGKIYAVGIGPGALDLLTPRAKDVLKSVEVVVGYTSYIDKIRSLIQGQDIVVSGMKGEVERCGVAISKAQQGQDVAIVSSGDPGVYGMAGLVLEMLHEKGAEDIEFESVPGITAASAAGAVLGAPLMNDFVVLSLSDLLTPRDVIKKRIDAALAGDFVTVLYNPRSRKRVELFDYVVSKFKKVQGEDSLFGLVRHASGYDEEVVVGMLSELPTQMVDMSTVVVLGNSKTVLKDKKLYTLRGYGDKYNL